MITKEDRKWASKDWRKVMTEMKKNHGKQQYDCVLGWSGGKDSTSMLHYLVNVLGLNPLAVSDLKKSLREIVLFSIKILSTKEMI